MIKNKTTEIPKKEIVDCPLCGTTLKEKNLKKHIDAHYQKPPISIRKSKFYWFNRPLKYDDFPDVREYVDSILENRKENSRFKPSSFIADASAILGLIDEMKSKLPQIINPKISNEYLNPFEIQHQIICNEIDDMYWLNSHKQRWKKIDKNMKFAFNDLLNEYNILSSKYEEKVETIQFRRKVLDRLKEDLKKASIEGLIATSVNWEILPRNNDFFIGLSEHYLTLSKKTRDNYDNERLRKICTLKPQEVKKGVNNFEGYCVFIFEKYNEIIFECPKVGNATYIAKGDWKQLSKFTKKELLNLKNKSIVRIVHQGDWFSGIRSNLSKKSHPKKR